MSERVRVRPSTVADLDAVMAIADGLDTAPHWPRSAYEAAIDPSSAPPRIALVAERDGVIVGFSVASLIPPEAELEIIAVSPGHQRQKAGSALLATLREELESRGVSVIVLEVRASNPTAQEFYRSHSFAEFARREAYYWDTGEAAILMRASIAARRKME
jgi:[ribosomal protein S18]-alanine N-acetyltransferase